MSADPWGLDGGFNLSGFDGTPTQYVDPVGLSGNPHQKASELPVIKPGTKEWADAVADMRAGGESHEESRRYDRREEETYSGTAVKDPLKRWDEFLGPDQTNIDPRDGRPDPDRIWSADGKRSIRFGSHEMDSKPNLMHYHEKTWHDDHVDNVVQR